MVVDFFFSTLPAVNVSFVRTLGQNRTECGAGGPDSAEGFQFVLTTAGHRDLRSCGSAHGYLQGNKAHMEVFTDRHESRVYS